MPYVSHLQARGSVLMSHRTCSVDPSLFGTPTRVEHAQGQMKFWVACGVLLTYSANDDTTTRVQSNSLSNSLTSPSVLLGCHYLVLGYPRGVVHYLRRTSENVPQS